MSVRLSLLALLAQGPCYGYQLRTELDWRTGGAGPINVGQIYNTLDRLERDKLVRKTGANNYYEITPAGVGEVAAWFASASSSAELPSKLALAATLPGVDVAAIIRAQRAALVAVDPGAVPTSAEDLARSVVAEAQAALVEADTRVLDAAERLLALDIGRQPLATEVPRRGRPAKATA